MTQRNLFRKVFLIAVFGFFQSFSFVLAAATVTIATGGSTVSADTVGASYTSLTGPVISEGATVDIGTGTIILNTPSGFVFDTGGTAPTVLVTRISGNGNSSRNINGLASGSTIAVTRASTTLTVTITSSTNNSVKNSLTWQNIRVRPTSGTPLASGNIVKSGSSSVSGVTNNVTNFGTLTETVGAKTQLAFTVQPNASAYVDTDFAVKPTVKLQDQFGNTVTSDNSSAIVLTPKLSTQTCAGTSGSGAITSTPASGATVVSGIMAYTAMRYSFGESIKICAASSGVTSVLSNIVTVNNPLPSTSSISPVSKNVGDVGFSLTVNGSNFVTGGVSTVNFNGSPRATSFVSSTQVAGTITTNDMSVATSGAQITVTNRTPGGGTSNSQVFSVIQRATKFIVSAATGTTVDSPITVTVLAQKPDNSVDVSFQGGVTLNTSGSATGGGLVTIINGVGAKVIADVVPETVHFSLSDTQGTGLDVSSFANVIWSAGATTQLSLNHTATLSAGNRAAYTITRKDQYGNITTVATTTVYFYSSSLGANKKFYDAATLGNIVSSIIIPPGQSSAQVWYYDELSGSLNITASDNSSAPDGTNGISDAVDTLVITFGPVSQFVLDNPGNMTAGTRLGYIVTRKDAFGNLVTGGISSVYLYSTAGVPGVNRAFYNVPEGGSAVTSLTINDGSSSGSFWYYENVSGNYTVSASDNAVSPDGALGVIDGSANVVVSSPPIVATRFVILDSVSGTVDSPITVTVEAQNNAGDVDTSATSSVTLTTSGSATGGGMVTLVHGIGMIQISDHHAETVTATLSDTQNTGFDVSSTKDILFAVGATAQFFVDNPGDMSAGTRLGFTVVRKDRYGNLVTSGTEAVYLYSSSLGANKRFYDASSGGSVITFVNILAGQSSASLWYYDELSGSAIVTVSDNMTVPDGAIGISDTDRIFAVIPAAIAKFTIDDPGNMTSRTRLEYTLARTDQFDNPVTSGVVSAYLYSSSAGASTKFYDTATGGTPTVLAVFLDGSATVHFWYYEEIGGEWIITASDSAFAPNGTAGVLDATDSIVVSMLPITATRFVIRPVNDSTVGVPVQITIRAEDDSGNVDTANNFGVTLNVSGSATGGGVVTLAHGVGTALINDTISEIVALSLSDTQNTGLNASSTQTLGFIAGSFFLVNNGWLGTGGATVYLPPAIVSRLHFSGKAFPGAELHVVAIGGKGTMQKQTASASTKGNFSFSFDNTSENTGSYGVFGTDKDNHSTQLKVFDANLANSSLLLDANGILLSPTLGLSRGSVTKGDTLGIGGSAVPFNTIEIEVNNRPVKVAVKADNAGLYKAIIPTSLLDYGSHVVRTRQIGSSGLKSEFSPQAVFSIVNIFSPNMDFNKDGAVNVKDWSIFVSRWSSDNSKIRIRNDLNGDGKTDAQDLSIFVRTLNLH